MGQVANGIAAVPIYFFNAPPPDHTTIQVEVLPYGGGIPINKDTGKLVAPATGPLTCEIETSAGPCRTPGYRRNSTTHALFHAPG